VTRGGSSRAAASDLFQSLYEGFNGIAYKGDIHPVYEDEYSNEMRESEGIDGCG
jgi:hypothetical protein